jgi:hypothetical protein
VGFYLCIFNFARRLNEAAMGGAVARSAPVQRVMSLKRCAQYTGALRHKPTQKQNKYIAFFEQKNFSLRRTKGVAGAGPTDEDQNLRKFEGLNGGKSLLPCYYS